MRETSGIGLKWSIMGICAFKTALLKKNCKIYEKNACICPEISAIMHLWWVGGISSPLSLRVPQPAFFWTRFFGEWNSFFSKVMDFLCSENRMVASSVWPALTLSQYYDKALQPISALKEKRVGADDK